MANPKSEIRNPKLGSVEFASGSIEDTLALGERIGGLLQPGDILALHGALGSGKTTLIQGMARGLGVTSGLVKSPTFVLMREYPGTIPLIHIDGYRLEGPTAASWLDVELLFSPQKITVIEWAERLGDAVPECALDVQLRHVSANRRRIRAAAVSPRGRAVLETLRDRMAESAQEVVGDAPRN
jgi:tRNA threonylcarbamoyladenosine biosynthesis protein TsaE